jgi:hypothetical protein
MSIRRHRSAQHAALSRMIRRCPVSGAGAALFTHPCAAFRVNVITAFLPAKVMRRRFRRIDTVLKAGISGAR